MILGVECILTNYEVFSRCHQYSTAILTFPVVTSVQCPSPENPRNGKAIYTSTSYNSVVSYECRYGYTLVGESSRRCGADKRWTGTLPACKGYRRWLARASVVLNDFHFRNQLWPSGYAVQRLAGEHRKRHRPGSKYHLPVSSGNAAGWEHFFGVSNRRPLEVSAAAVFGSVCRAVDIARTGHTH